MDEKILSSLRNADVQTKAVLFSVIIGFIIMTILLFQIHEERYSQVYINPDSIKIFQESNICYFIYGIKSFEKSDTVYNVTFYIDEELVEQKDIRLHPGENFEELKSVNLIGQNITGKIRLLARTPYNEYDVFFWIK